MPVSACLNDHKAAMLDKVSTTVETFVANNPAAGSAGIEAAPAKA